MGIPVLLIGFEGKEPDVPGMEFVRLAPTAAARICLEGYRVAVLGDHALRECDPHETRGHLRRKRLVLLLCPASTSHARVTEWVIAGFVRVCDPPNLEAVLRDVRDEVLADLVRPILDLEDWCRILPPAGSDLERALWAVPHLDCAHSVADWADAAGCTPKHLWEMCRENLGVPPSTVLSWYIQTVTRWTWEEGWPPDRIAALLGFHDRPALVGSIEAHGGTFPPRKRPRRKPNQTKPNQGQPTGKPPSVTKEPPSR